MKDLGEGMVMVPYEDGSVAVHCHGNGPDLICLHATGHDGADFADLSARLDGRYRVLAVDFPGHGHSEPGTEPASAESYAAPVRAVIDALCTTPPVVLGNSIGGAVAMILASEGRTRAVVLCNSGGLLDVTPQVRRITALFARFFRAGARGAWWFPVAFRLYYRMVLPKAPVRRRAIAQGIRGRADVLAEAWESFGRKEADLRAVAASLSVPVLVAWAKDDKAIRLAHCKDAIARIPDHRLQLFQGGHAAFLEDPERFATCLTEFLDGLA